ncbi:hypothetical protein L1887_05457 [Cichorium endivia]|nr:hypothetical protein L1887_05457 [Cichorium endivia]
MFEGALVTRETENPFPKTSDPRVQLSGNFAPVPEQAVKHNLPVSGCIPDCINGELHGHSGVARLALFYARSLLGLVDHSKDMRVANAGL